MFDSPLECPTALCVGVAREAIGVCISKTSVSDDGANIGRDCRRSDFVANILRKHRMLHKNDSLLNRPLAWLTRVVTYYPRVTVGVALPLALGVSV